MYTKKPVPHSFTEKFPIDRERSMVFSWDSNGCAVIAREEMLVIAQRLLLMQTVFDIIERAEGKEKPTIQGQAKAYRQVVEALKDV